MAASGGPTATMEVGHDGVAVITLQNPPVNALHPNGERCGRLVRRLASQRGRWAGSYVAVVAGRARVFLSACSAAMSACARAQQRGAAALSLLVAPPLVLHALLSAAALLEFMRGSDKR